MSPGFERGDILFLAQTSSPYKAGDICVFTVAGKEIPIVHRVIKVHEDVNGNIKVLTKGDFNDEPDRGLYNYRQGQLWLENKDFIARVQATVPFLGIITILITDYPQLKHALIAVIGGMALFIRE